jgi:hypothetical protein
MAKNVVLKVDEKWRAESDLDTWLRWREIKKDPKRLKAVRDLANERLKDYASLTSASDDNDEDD